MPGANTESTYGMILRQKQDKQPQKSSPLVYERSACHQIFYRILSNTYVIKMEVTSTKRRVGESGRRSVGWTA